jgi:hypothetical protein
MTGVYDGAIDRSSHGALRYDARLCAMGQRSKETASADIRSDGRYSAVSKSVNGRPGRTQRANIRVNALAFDSGPAGPLFRFAGQAHVSLERTKRLTRLSEGRARGNDQGNPPGGSLF